MVLSAPNAAGLAAVAVFRGLPPAGLGRLAALARIRQFAPGEALVRQGEPGKWLDIIRHGHVRLERGHPDPVQPALPAVVWPGEVVGEEGLLDGRSSRATARAIDEVETLRLSHTAVAVVLVQCEAAASFAAAVRRGHDGGGEPSSIVRRPG
jgi:CRP-like cAMP-binding protein